MGCRHRCGFGAAIAGAFGLPGFQGTETRAKGSIRAHGIYAGGISRTRADRYAFHFPDGNATIARLLVRNLIPGAVPGSSVEDIVTARVELRQLDRGGNAGAHPAEQHRHPRPASRRCRNRPTRSKSTYLRGGQPFTRTRAAACVLAGYNMMIPYLCPELPAAQKEALHQLVKTPLVYTSVALRNWQRVREARVSRVVCAGRLSLLFPLESACRHRRLSQRAIAAGADAGAHGAHPLPSRLART